MYSLVHAKQAINTSTYLENQLSLATNAFLRVFHIEAKDTNTL